MNIIFNKLRNKLNSFSQHNRGQTIKKISWITGYNPPNQFASTRIRVYYPHTSINKYYADKYNSIIGYNSKADILILQKTIKSSNIRKIKRFKGFIIYDFDDPISKHSFDKIMPYVNLITTDTVERKKEFDKLEYNVPCEVLEDCLDYNFVDAYETPYISNKVSWFGNYPNYDSVKWMSTEIIKNNFELNLITDIENIRAEASPFIKKIQWNLETFINDLRCSNICIMSHAGSDSIYKSNNKMIVAIAAGLPCIVNESTNYETLAKLFSLDYSIVNDDASLRYALNYLNNIENRKEYLKDIQPYVLNNFSSKIISKKLLQLIENYREK